MKMPKKEKRVDFMPIEEAIRITKDLLSDHLYASQRVRSPKAKRLHETNISFWGSVSYHLSLINNLTEDEFSEIEEKYKSKKEENHEN